MCDFVSSAFCRLPLVKQNCWYYITFWNNKGNNDVLRVNILWYRLLIAFSTTLNSSKNLKFPSQLSMTFVVFGILNFFNINALQKILLFYLILFLVPSSIMNLLSTEHVVCVQVYKPGTVSIFFLCWIFAQCDTVLDDLIISYGTTSS